MKFADELVKQVAHVANNVESVALLSVELDILPFLPV